MCTCTHTRRFRACLDVRAPIAYLLPTTWTQQTRKDQSPSSGGSIACSLQLARPSPARVRLPRMRLGTRPTSRFEQMRCAMPPACVLLPHCCCSSKSWGTPGCGETTDRASKYDACAILRNPTLGWISRSWRDVSGAKLASYLGARRRVGRMDMGAGCVGVLCP
jgi:hypothetical protein